MAGPPPRGIYVPVPTFFVRKNSKSYDAVTAPVDVQTQASHAVYLAKSGIRGLVLLGSTGEAVHLSNAERGEIIRGVRKALGEAGFAGYPLIAGTAAQAVEETVRQLKEAREADAQWGLVLAPGYFAGAVAQRGLIEWYRAVADRSPMPIMVYHYPGVSNKVAVTPETMEKLAKHPNIVGCKLSHGNVDDHALIALSPSIDHGKFQTFTGLGQQLLAVLAVGGAGAIDGLAAAFPRTVVRLFDLFEEDCSREQLEKLRALQYRVCAGEKLVVKWGTIGIKEMVSRVRGFGDPDGGRLPLKGGFPGGDAEWEKWKTAMDGLDAVERTLLEAGGS